MARYRLDKSATRRSSFGSPAWAIGICMLLITAYLAISGMDEPAATRVYLASDSAGNP